MGEEVSFFLSLFLKHQDFILFIDLCLYTLVEVSETLFYFLSISILGGFCSVL